MMDVLAVPLGELISAVGRSVAGAQQTMDERFIEHFSAIYDQSVAAFEPLRAIGYQPTWYQIPEATAEIALAITVGGPQVDAASSVSRRRDLYGAPVDAGYQSRFNYRLKTASSLKFRIVPVPPPEAATRLPSPDLGSEPDPRAPGA
jgi:hypothetical protein